ncbi:MAG: hypothetical protein AABY83_11315 [Pseudomonadota bacterium]
MNAIIKLNLNADQLNTVLLALSQLPYHQVHELIEHIQSEAGPQLLAASRLLKAAATQVQNAENQQRRVSESQKP